MQSTFTEPSRVQIGATAPGPAEIDEQVRNGQCVRQLHFAWSAAGNAGVAIFLALCVPWIPFGPRCMDADLFLVIYLFVLLRFFTIIAAIDTSSPFGGFGASREIMLPGLV